MRADACAGSVSHVAWHVACGRPGDRRRPRGARAASRSARRVARGACACAGANARRSAATDLVGVAIAASDARAARASASAPMRSCARARTPFAAGRMGRPRAAARARACGAWHIGDGGRGVSVRSPLAMACHVRIAVPIWWAGDPGRRRAWIETEALAGGERARACRACARGGRGKGWG